VRCVPPDNAPSRDEIARCARFVDAEAALVSRAKVALVLGAIAWSAWLDHLARIGAVVPRPRPRFAHGAEVTLGGMHVISSYHPSQQNTQTGRLTLEMFDRVVLRARALAGLPDSS
jgi:uracil-DNA glycosylase family 4